MSNKKLPSLDACVLAAVSFFADNKPKTLDVTRFSLPLIIGSGNAYNAAQIIFSGRPAIFASESTVRQSLESLKKLIRQKAVDRAVIVSASGEKDSVWEIKLAKKYGLKTTLLTCNANSSAAKLADEVIVSDKLPEPYTYNFSTYFSLIVGAHQETAAGIEAFLRRLKLPKDFGRYSAYAFVLPDEFAAIAPMIEIKRDELFGPNLNIRAFSLGEARHAKFVNPSEKELVISFGPNAFFGNKKQRLEISWPRRGGQGLALALSYYLVGKIQEAKPDYFRKNIARFCQEGPKAYGSHKPFPLIVN
jgi:hypothetical protein